MTNERQKSAVVVEFKIDSPLKAHQDFRSDEFFTTFEGKAGYGKQIIEWNSKNNSKTLKYVILLKKSERENLSLNPDWKKGIQCYSRVWTNLLYGENEPPLVEDLLDSLAQYIPELNHRIYANMNKSQYTKDAAEMYQILAGVSENTLNSKKPSLDANKGDGDVWFGTDIPKSSEGFESLKKRIDSKWRSLGWFGYVHTGDGRDLRQVWIYCGSSPSKEILKWIRRGLGSQGVQCECDQNNCVIIQCTDCSSGDLEWFQSVLSKLKSLPGG